MCEVVSLQEGGSRKFIMQSILQLTEGDFEGQTVRTTHEYPKRVSVIDIIKVVSRNINARKGWADLQKSHPEVVTLCDTFKFPGQGQQLTPVTDARGLVMIINLLPGERAAKFRAKGADIVVRYLGGDESLIAEIEQNRVVQANLPDSNPARLFGEDVEARKLALAEKQFESEVPLRRIRVMDEVKARLEAMDMWGVTEKMTYKDNLSNILGGYALTAPGPIQKLYTFSEWLEREKGTVVSYKSLQIPGRSAAAEYRRLTGEDPPTKKIECNGRLCDVKVYSDTPVVEGGPTGFEILEDVWSQAGLSM
ncbi:hypothetical protein WJX74_003840 [Apatococcus lobatus]|uniref:Uncharacterized protein n=1 Tax=Apatococcus lobatus TaxID=904363 RepID=A0AAW1RAV8_9CHLO